MRLIIDAVHPIGYPVHIELDPYENEPVDRILDRLAPKVTTVLERLGREGYQPPLAVDHVAD